MEINLQWDDLQHTVVHLAVGTDWTWDDLVQAFRQYVEMVQETRHPVSLLIDIPVIRRVPPTFSVELIRATGLVPPHARRSVVITRSPVVRMLIEVMRRLGDPLCVQAVYATTLDEARAILAGQGHPERGV